MHKVEEAFEIGKRIHRIEKNFISNLRAKIAKEKGKTKMEEGGKVKISKEEHETGIVMDNKELEDNMAAETAMIKQEMSDDDLVTEIKVEEEKFQDIKEVQVRKNHFGK